MSDNTSPDSKAIGGPRDGKYYILPAVLPKLIVGVDGVGNPWVPVVTDGKNNVFTIEKLDNGGYTLVLEDGHIPQFIQDDDGKLVGNEKPPATAWFILGNHCGPYRITRPPIGWLTKSWTLTNDKPGSPVGLKNVELPGPEHWWNFVPWIGPEFK